MEKDNIYFAYLAYKNYKTKKAFKKFLTDNNTKMVFDAIKKFNPIHTEWNYIDFYPHLYLQNFENADQVYNKILEKLGHLI